MLDIGSEESHELWHLNNLNLTVLGHIEVSSVLVGSILAMNRLVNIHTCLTMFEFQHSLLVPNFHIFHNGSPLIVCLILLCFFDMIFGFHFGVPLGFLLGLFFTVELEQHLSLALCNLGGTSPERKLLSALLATLMHIAVTVTRICRICDGLRHLVVEVLLAVHYILINHMIESDYESLNCNCRNFINSN